MSLKRTNTKGLRFVRVVQVEQDGEESVYNMEVEDNHNFAVNGGMIVHNCMDAVRYFIKTKHILRQNRRR